MATTYELIASDVLGSAAGSVSFTSIPSTFDDLVVVQSSRITSVAAYYTNILVRFNSDSGSNYSQRLLYGLSGSASSLSETGQDGIRYFYATADSATSNTFASGEFYIPNYAGSANKSVLMTSVTESNHANGPLIAATAALWASGSAITSISMQPNGAVNFAAGSSFFLYGITKA